MFKFDKEVFKKPSTKIIITVFLGLVIISAYFIISNYYTYLKLAEKSSLRRLQAIANTLSNQISGDDHLVLINRYNKQGDLKTNTQDSLYYMLWEKLHRAQIANNLETEIATLYYNSNTKKMIYVLNSTYKPYICDPYEKYTEEFLTHYYKGGMLPTYKDEFGTWLSAISPIKSKKGDVVGIVEVDESFNYFMANAREMLIKNLLISLSIFSFVALLVLYYIRQITKAEDAANKQIEISNHIISQKNKDILDSINYAKRIQNAILAPKEEVFITFKDAFILYKPKDIVSDDFYYFAKVKNKTIIAAADCTGHGVPGALMSMIGNDLLNHVTQERNVDQPGQILDLLHKGITNVLKQDGKITDTRDGMDISLLSFDLENTELQYAGAYRSLCIVRNGELTEYKANKFPIGNAVQERTNFTNNIIEIQKGDMCYAFTDGYADQFGGDKGKKFMVKKFHELLVSISAENVKEQERILDNVIEKWRGSNDQVDDMLIIGIRV